MSADSLRELDFESIDDLYHQIMGSEAAFAVCDLKGDPIWLNPGSHGPELTLALQQTVAADVFDKPCRETSSCQTGVGASLYYHPLATTLAGPFGFLATLALTRDEQDLVVVSRVFKVVATIIETQFQLTEELNDMADDLIGRHEELNLVYRLDDHISRHSDAQGLCALNKMIDDCIEFMSIDGVILYLPQDRVYETKVAQGCSETLPELQEIWARARQRLLARLKVLHVPIVINSPTDAEYQNAEVGSSMRLAAVPIVDVRTQVCGFLAVVAGPSRPVFTNGDRKLLEVLCKQISAIVKSGYDGLTGLLNREGLEQRLQSAVLDDGISALLVVDIEQFSIISDSYGRSAGVELLKQIAKFIEQITRSSDSIARIGGSQFALLLEKCPDKVALNIGQQLIRAIKELRFSWDSKLFDVSACIGMVSLGDDAAEYIDPIDLARSACLVAKDKGSDQIYLYRKTDPLMTEYQGRLEWVPRIQEALEHSGFILYAQPIVAVTQDCLVPHFEILIRMLDRQGELIQPYKFIGPAEYYNLMPKVDRWVLEKTLQQLAELPDGYFAQGTLCSINLSGQSLSDEGFLEFIETQCRHFEIPPQWICFEITETAAISNISEAMHLIGRLKEQGFRFALDDFGTGLSSFSYLNNLPVDYLKIDGEFVKDIHENEVHAMMVSAINGIGHAMGLKTIAEYVENPAIVKRLTEIGVDYAQGYELGRPVPFVDLLADLQPRTLRLAVSR